MPLAWYYTGIMPQQKIGQQRKHIKIYSDKKYNLAHGCNDEIV